MNAKQIIRAEIFSLVGIIKNRNIVDLFLQRNISRSIIYRAIKDCIDGKDWSYKKSSGRPRITSEKNDDKMVSNAINKIGASTRTLMFHI